MYFLDADVKSLSQISNLTSSQSKIPPQRGIKLKMLQEVGYLVKAVNQYTHDPYLKICRLTKLIIPCYL